MNPSWQECLSASGATIENGRIADFGDPAAERLAARDATVLAPLAHLGLIECAGEEATSFLHNQLTSDINHLADAKAQYSAWCTAKGRMLASFILYREAAAYRALLATDLLEAIQKRLQMFVLRSKVLLGNLSSTHVSIGLSGPEAETALNAAALPVPADPLDTAAFSGGSVIRLDALRFIVVADVENACALWPRLATLARPVGPAVWQWLDIQAGIPLIGEATKEAFVPQMANFDKIGGVSFHKGCYPGQEIVARTQYLGKVKRHLYRVSSDEVMSDGMPIFASGNPDHPGGMVANAAPSPDGGFDALAVIQEDFIGGELELGRPGGARLRGTPVEA